MSLVVLAAIVQIIWYIVLAEPNPQNGVILEPLGTHAKATNEKTLTPGTITPLTDLATTAQESPTNANPKPQESSAALKILNLNACVLPRGAHFSEDDRKQARLKDIFKQFVAGGYDIGIYQEIWESIFCKEIVSDFYKMFQEAGFYVSYSPLYKWTFGTGNVIISKYPIIEANVWIYQTSSGWQKMMPNGILHAKIQLPGERLLDVYNTHQHSDNKPGDHWMNFSFKEIRRGQTVELLEFAKITNPDDNLFIYAWDWNVPGGKPEYHDMVKQIGSHSNLETEAVITGKWPATLNGKHFLMRSDWANHSDVSLDHAFSNGKFSDTKVLSEWNISDHFAIELSVTPHPKTTVTSGPDIKPKDKAASRFKWGAIVIVHRIFHILVSTWAIILVSVAFFIFAGSSMPEKQKPGKSEVSESEEHDLENPKPRETPESVQPAGLAAEI